jgi:hypothetical protein
MQTIKFDKPQNINIVVRDVLPEQSEVILNHWQENHTPIVDEEGNNIGNNIHIHVGISGIKFPLTNLLFNNQSRLKEILDSVDTNENKKSIIFKEAIESGDYNSEPVGAL